MSMLFGGMHPRGTDKARLEIESRKFDDNQDEKSSVDYVNNRGERVIKNKRLFKTTAETTSNDLKGSEKVVCDVSYMDGDKCHEMKEILRDEVSAAMNQQKPVSVLTVVAIATFTNVDPGNYRNASTKRQELCNNAGCLSKVDDDYLMLKSMEAREPKQLTVLDPSLEVSTNGSLTMKYYVHDCNQIIGRSSSSQPVPMAVCRGHRDSDDSSIRNRDARECKNCFKCTCGQCIGDELHNMFK